MSNRKNTLEKYMWFELNNYLSISMFWSCFTGCSVLWNVLPQIQPIVMHIASGVHNFFFLLLLLWYFFFVPNICGNRENSRTNYAHNHKIDHLDTTNQASSQTQAKNAAN